MRRRRVAVPFLLSGCLVATGCLGSSGQRSLTQPAPSLSLPASTAAPSPTPTPTVTPTATHSATPVPTPSSCALPVSRWTADQLAGAVITAPAQLADLPASLALVRSGVGGLVLFGTPTSDVGAQLARLHVAAGAWPLVVSSDEEGGGIQRLAALTGALPWARDMASSSPSRIRVLAEAMGARLRALGVRVDLAPVADLDAGPGPDASHPDGKRSFSADPAAATADVLAFAEGLRDAGVVPVLKHFPGIGTASGNTDDSAATTAPLSQLLIRDLKPFEAAIAAGMPAMMTSNAVVPGLSSRPVSVSTAATTGLLRTRLGFQGVVITDSLSAGAISAAGLSLPAAAVAALAAGADDVLIGRGDTTNAGALVTPVRAAIAQAVTRGVLSMTRLRASVRRLATLMGARTC